MTTSTELTRALKEAPFQCVMRATPIPGRTDQTETPRDRNASHYHISLTREGCGVKPTIHVEYSMGSALKGGPKLADVMHALLTDSRAGSMTFEEWCDDFGYDSDSRKAENLYNECRKTAIKVGNLFSADDIDQLNDMFAEY